MFVDFADLDERKISGNLIISVKAPRKQHKIPSAPKRKRAINLSKRRASSSGAHKHVSQMTKFDYSLSNSSEDDHDDKKKQGSMIKKMRRQFN